MWQSNDLSLIWAAWLSSRDLWQTPPVRELFKPAEFGSRFLSGAKAQSSWEGWIKLNISLFDGCWVAVSSEFIGCWFNICSDPFKISSWVSGLLLVVEGCWMLSSEWCFALLDGRELLEASSILVVFSVIFYVKNLPKFLAARLNSVGNLISMAWKSFEKFLLVSATQGSVSNCGDDIGSPSYRA